MSNNIQEEKASLRNVLDGFLYSYVDRSINMRFSEWLSARIRQEVLDMTEEAGNKLTGEIIEAVARYDRTLEELNSAINGGESGEEWFARCMEKAYAGLAPDEVGRKLQEIESSYAVSNMQLMQEIDRAQGGEEIIVEDSPIEWDEYSIKDKVSKIGKQIALSGVAVAANVVKEKVENKEDASIENVVKETFQKGLKQNPAEIKAVVAGAVKVAATKGLEDRIPEDMPVETICDMAGVAVEGAEALLDVVNGDSTMTDAMDKMCRASLAAGGHCCAGMIKGLLSKLPGGFLIADLSSGLLDHLKSSKFVENIHKIGKDVCNTVRDMAIDTWKGIKESTIGRVFIKIERKLHG